ncbi:MAG: phosphatidate cytidylyltransferase [Bifidobacterium crudilactis]|jgi:phosphatidate cytidylyltransferase|nr:phosphatidate cytidylyltransferase [Bifidobacterium crudilactis]MCI1889485.1 phosphatidate cytidylyltransferase [Bifidobacterium crudilactis]
MTNSGDRHGEAEDALQSINKRTGRNMPQAVATGAVLVVVILASLLIRVDAFVVLIMIFMILGLWELRVDFATAGLHIPLLTLCLCSSASLLLTYYASDHLLAMMLCVMATVLLVCLSASTRINMGTRVSVAVARKLSSSDSNARVESSYNKAAVDEGEHQSRMSNVGASLFTVLYIPLLACFLVLPLTFGGHPVAHAFMSIFLPALSDIGGLFFGAWFGKHKLSPRISPKKSVEGLIGSMLFSTVGALSIVATTYDASQWASHWWVPVLLGMMTGVVGTFGDLCASMLKRDIGIKDMGHLLRGHGGVLDRVDSILLAAPFIATVLFITGI